MLKRLGGTVDPKGAATAIKDAEFPVPFASELEFNSPVHGTWNIVHTGMQVLIRFTSVPITACVVLF